uniref:Uncharacterized protein n=1 Tax=Romanomermis culicivorax TaxID=13658 RepID=A0A915HHP1_ROMCU
MADQTSSVKTTTTTGNLSKNESKTSLSKINKTLSSQRQQGTINAKQFAMLSLPHKVDLDHRDDHHNQKLLKHFFPKQQEKMGSTIKAPLRKSKILSGGSLFDVQSKFSKLSNEKPKMAYAQKFKNVMNDVEKCKTTITPLSVVGKKTTTTLSRSIMPIPKSPELESNLLLNEPDVIISKSFQFSSVKSFDHRHGSRKLAVAAPLAGADSSRKDSESKIKKKPAPPFFSLLYWRQISECLHNQSLVAWLTIAVLSVVLCLVIFYVAAAISAFRAPEPPPPPDYY